MSAAEYGVDPEWVKRRNDEVAAKATAWFWCMHCHRVCQGKELLPDFLDVRSLCPHDGCDGCGHDVDIYEVDPETGLFFAESGVPDVSALRSGDLVPLYP